MDRQAVRAGDTTDPAVEWTAAFGADRALVIRSHDVARQLLGLREGTRQAGFQAEQFPKTSVISPPMIHLDGEDHRAQRRAAAKHFTHRTVTTRHSQVITTLAEDIVGRFEVAGTGELDAMAFRMAMRVVTAVLGMENSDLGAMERLLERYFEPFPPSSAPLWQRATTQVRVQSRTLRFYARHVRPEIQARRRLPEDQRPDDVISGFLARGKSQLDILGECLMYAAAGMITTRQLMAMSAWHLLRDDGLRARYLAGAQPERVRIIQEIVRLEPVGGTLLRRTTREIVLDVAGEALTVPEGTLVDIELRAVQLDAAAVGPEPGRLDPDRNPAAGIGPTAMAFGHGHHSCPGEPLALVETETFISRLFHDDRVQLVQAPEVTWNDVAQAYHLSGMRIARVPVPAA